MILYHWTPAENLESILSHGLLIRYATGERKAIWGVNTWEGRTWAKDHVALRHGCQPSRLACIMFHVPHEEAHPHGQHARWISHDIVPGAFLSVTFPEEGFNGLST